MLGLGSYYSENRFAAVCLYGALRIVLATAINDEARCM